MIFGEEEIPLYPMVFIPLQMIYLWYFIICYKTDVSVLKERKLLVISHVYCIKVVVGANYNTCGITVGNRYYERCN